MPVLCSLQSLEDQYSSLQGILGDVRGELDNAVTRCSSYDAKVSEYSLMIEEYERNVQNLQMGNEEQQHKADEVGHLLYNVSPFCFP